jgi:translation initiation factor IF-3
MKVYKVLEYGNYGYEEKISGIFTSKKSALKKIKNKRALKLAFFIEKTDNFMNTSVIQTFLKKKDKDAIKTEWFY